MLDSGAPFKWNPSLMPVIIISMEIKIRIIPINRAIARNPRLPTTRYRKKDIIKMRADDRDANVRPAIKSKDRPYC